MSDGGADSTRVDPKDRVAKGVSYYLMALVPVLSIFVIIPLELYINAAEYWRWNTSFPLNFVLIGCLVYAALLLCLYLIKRVSFIAFKRLALLLFALGIYVLLADILSPLQTGALDGSRLHSDQPLVYTALEIAILGVLVLAGYRLREHLEKVALLITVGLLALSLSYLFLGIWSTAPVPEVEDLVAGERSVHGNVYHFVLDELQTDAAIAALATRNTGNEYTGFRLYENNIANYIWTNASMPSYLTGALYREGDFKAWQEAFKKHGLFTRMYEGGYAVNLYAVYEHWCASYMQFCESLDQIYESRTGLVASDYITFIQIWFARILPNAITNIALEQGKQVGSFVYSTMVDTEVDIPKTIPKGKAPYSSVLMFGEMLAAEKSRAATGEYVYAHAILPHGPYVMNESCEYDANLWRSAGGKKAYFEQASCGLARISEFLAELKRLGRYDDATIVVHADTGHGHQGFVGMDEAGNIIGKDSVGLPPMELDKQFLRSETWYLARSMALLMIKAPGSGGALEIVDRKTQLIDVYPTIVEMAGLEPGEVDGVSVEGGALSNQRESHMYFTSPARPGEVTILEISDQKAITSSHIIVKSDDRVRPLSQSYSVLFGVNDSDAELSGFSYPEQDESGSDHWRWALGKSSSVDLSRRLQIGPGSYILELEIQPFTVNVGGPLAITVGGSTQEVTLEEGWKKYRLQYTFEQEVSAVIGFSYPQAATPESLGISADQRVLAARLRSISIRPDA